MPPGVPFWFFGPVRRGCRWFGLTADAAADYASAVSPRRGLICPWRGAWPTACGLPALSLGLVLREAQEQGSEPRLQAPGPGSAGAGAAWPPRSLNSAGTVLSPGGVWRPAPAEPHSGGRSAVGGLPWWMCSALGLLGPSSSCSRPSTPEPPGLRDICALGFYSSFFQ